MRAIVPRHISGIDQPQVGFIHKRSRLKAVARALTFHAPSRDLMKLSLYERNQLLEGRLVALAPFQEQTGSRGGMVRNAAILCLFVWLTVSTRRLTPW